MPSKPRHQNKKKTIKTSKKVTEAVRTPAQPKATEPVISSPRPVTSAPTAQAPATTMSYPYIKSELARTGIIAASIFIILVILYFVL